MKSTSPVVVIVLLLFSIAAHAQLSNFDVTTYMAPKGWKEAKKTETVTYTKEDPARGFCIITIYRSIDATNDAETNFKMAWQSLVNETLGATAEPKMEFPSTEEGWTTVAGHSLIEKDDTKMAVILASSTGSSKLSNVLIITNSNEYEKEITAFTGSVKLKTISSKPVAGPENLPIVKGDKADLWMNIQVKPGYGISTWQTNSVKFYVVYTNGDYYPDIPFNGLVNFNKTINAESWGKFTMQGNKGRFKSKYEDITVEKESATVMKKVGYTFKFYKCARVDGLRLEGSWSYIPNWSNDPYYSQAGCRQVIFFKKDGTFDDRGIFVSDCSQPNKNRQDTPGKGSYSISNFTIAFKYDDGRITYKAFSGVGNDNPATNNDVIFIGTNPFFKK